MTKTQKIWSLDPLTAITIAIIIALITNNYTTIIINATVGSRIASSCHHVYNYITANNNVFTECLKIAKNCSQKLLKVIGASLISYCH